MPHILVRDLDERTIKRLKVRARQHGRSLQGELRVILEQATTLSFKEAREVAEEWRRRLRGREFTDSARLIRADRSR